MKNNKMTKKKEVDLEVLFKKEEPETSCDNHADVCKDCVNKNFDEFMDAKCGLEFALDWLTHDMVELDCDINNGEEVTERLEQFKKACAEVIKAADLFIMSDKKSE